MSFFFQISNLKIPLKSWVFFKRKWFQEEYVSILGDLNRMYWLYSDEVDFYYLKLFYLNLKKKRTYFDF